MKKCTVISSVLSAAFLFAALIMGSSASASEYSSLELSKWHKSFTVEIVNDKEVARPVNITVTDFLSGGELANVVYVDGGKTYNSVGAFIDKYTMQVILPSGAKLICKRQDNGDIRVSYANAGGLNAADGTFHHISS